jgi:putative component of membrane protein insertase Oxa1/YidC/SpoIIIJ protein YidD
MQKLLSQELLTKLGVLIVFVGISLFAAGQNAKEDGQLILKKKLAAPHMHYHKAEFGIFKSENKWVKYNPVSLTLSSFLYAYQQWISPQISANCYYSPTCSAYSRLVFYELGFVRGALASADRLMRCDRISATSFHPLSINPEDGKIHENANRYRFHEK